MNIAGEMVKHIIFGSGKVINHDGNYIRVSFPIGEKEFPFPFVFSSHLVADNENIQAEIKKEIIRIDAEKAAQAQAEYQKDTSVPKHQSQNLRPQKTKSERKPNGRQYFFVFQNKSYESEFRGSYLWAPKYSADGSIVSHWKLMEDVHEGDVIFHSVDKGIVAISCAISDCYSSEQPKELKHEEMWQDEGWRVDCKYNAIKWPIITSDFADQIRQLQPDRYAPFNRLGKGNTGYLFSSNLQLSKFLFEKLLVKNTYLQDFAHEFGLDH